MASLSLFFIVDGGGAVEQLDRRPHRRLELEHRRRLGVARVDGLLVLDERQLDGARGGRGEGFRQSGEVDPEVVGVEELVPMFFWGALLFYFEFQGVFL